jgi:hypothetical protein
MPLKREMRRYVASGGRNFSAVTVDSLKVHGLLSALYMGADITDEGRAVANHIGGPLR